MKLSDRLKKVRESSGRTQKELATALNVSLTAIQGYEAGRQIPGGNILESLARLGVDINWLLTGEGAMNKGFSGIETREAGPAWAFEQKSDEYIHVPRYEIAASAGGGAVVQSEQIVDFISFKEEWVRNSLGASAKNLALISVKGDSMEPTLSDGDLVLVDISSRTIEANAIYVLQFWGSLMVKRIQRKVDGTVVIKSDNQIYETETITGELLTQLNIIGRVVWYGKRA